MLCTNNRSEKSRGLTASTYIEETYYPLQINGCCKLYKIDFQEDFVEQFVNILKTLSDNLIYTTLFRNVNTTCLLNVDVYATLQLSVVDISLPEKKTREIISKSSNKQLYGYTLRGRAISDHLIIISWSNQVLKVLACIFQVAKVCKISTYVLCLLTGSQDQSSFFEDSFLSRHVSQQVPQ